MIPLFKVAMNDQVGNILTPILTSGFITQGPKVEEFEKRLSEYIGNDKILTLNSATAGLTLALRMVAEQGDEVLTTALTCTATNWPILANNMKIKWVDVDPNTGNMDLDDLKNKLTPKTKVIMAVHWGGYPNDLDKLRDIQYFCLNKFGFRPTIIEDCAHAFGAEYNGKKLGNHGNICIFSFQAIKHLTTGDGGMIVLPSQDLYDRAKLLRWYGIDRNARNFNLKDFRLEKDISEWGYKFHMNDISATIGLANFDLAVDNLKKHRNNAQFFFQTLKNIDGVTLVSNSEKCNGSWWIYSIKVQRKQEFINFMKEHGIIVSQVHNRNDNHSCVAEFKTVQGLPNLDQLEKELVCIPVGWWLNFNDLEKIISKIKDFIAISGSQVST